MELYLLVKPFSEHFNVMLIVIAISVLHFYILHLSKKYLKHA